MKKQRYDIRIRDKYDISLSLKAWLKENKIKNYSWYHNGKGEVLLSFKYEEDAMAYKLRWL